MFGYGIDRHISYHSVLMAPNQTPRFDDGGSLCVYHQMTYPAVTVLLWYRDLPLINQPLQPI